MTTPATTARLGAVSRMRWFVRTHRAVSFIAVSFVWSWAWWWPLVLTGQSVTPRHGWPSQFPGLVGPLIGALVTTGVADGPAGLRKFVGRLWAWRIGGRGWWLALGTPLAMLGVGVAASGGVPVSTLDDMSGVSELGVAGLWLVAMLVNGLGEEAGWRGFLLPTLRSRHAPVPAAARVTAVWALWHLPLFWLLATYRGFSPFTATGFLIGLGAGSVVLAHVYEHTGASILAAAVWHGTYNLAAATGDDPARAAVVTALVIAWAIGIARRAAAELGR